MTRDLDLGDSRILMGDQLSPRDAEEIARISGATLEAVTHTSYLRYENGWNIGISFMRSNQGYYSALHAYKTDVDFPVRAWTDSGLVVSGNSVVIARYQDSEGILSLQRMILQAGRAELSLSLGSPLGATDQMAGLAAAQALIRFPRSPRGG